MLGINPFNQPDVEDAKIKTRELTAAFEKIRRAAGRTAGDVVRRGRCLSPTMPMPRRLRKAGADGGLGSWLKAHLGRVAARRLCGAARLYRARCARISTPCSTCGWRCATQRHVATCAEFGPRFLHSTGQAYKGGPDSGVFLQITADDAKDLAVPGQKASFGVIKAAQARGDFDVLTERGRRALRVHLKGDLEVGTEDARYRDHRSAELS